MTLLEAGAKIPRGPPLHRAHCAEGPVRRYPNLEPGADLLAPLPADVRMRMSPAIAERPPVEPGPLRVVGPESPDEYGNVAVRPLTPEPGHDR